MLKKLTQQVLRGVKTINIPGVDMTLFLNQSPGWEDDCKAITNNLRDYGVLYVKVPELITATIGSSSTSFKNISPFDQLSSNTD